MKKTIILLALLGLGSTSNAQDLLGILEDEAPETKNYVSSTFKGTRILNGHSVENRKKGTLEFLISYRFGRLNLGIDELFGLDQSNIRFAFEHALTDNFMLGVVRSSFEKTYDGFFKYKLVSQSTGKNLFPATISLFGSVAYKTIKDYDPNDKPDFSNRLYFTGIDWQQNITWDI